MEVTWGQHGSSMEAAWEQHGISMEHHGSSMDGNLNYTVNYIMNYIMDCSMNHTNPSKQIKQVVVNLAQVNKRFNSVKVLPTASHCQSEFKINMV